jgi:hypothetical protein
VAAITIFVRNSAIGNIDRASLEIQAFGTSHLRVPELRRVKRLHPASFHHTDKPVLSSDSCFIASPSQNQDRRVLGYGIGSGASRQQSLSIPFHHVLVDRRHFRIFIDCAAAFGTRKPMLIANSKAMILIILSFVSFPSWSSSSRGIVSPSPLLALLI